MRVYCVKTCTLQPHHKGHCCNCIHHPASHFPGTCDNYKPNDCRSPNGQLESCSDSAGDWVVPGIPCVTPTTPPSTAAPTTSPPHCKSVICDFDCWDVTDSEETSCLFFWESKQESEETLLSCSKTTHTSKLDVWVSNIYVNPVGNPSYVTQGTKRWW